MKMKSVLPYLFMSFVVLAGCAGKEKAPEVVKAQLPTTLAEAVNSDFRDPENKKRDGARHPQETLEFFEITPALSVVEIWPSGGWYTQILAPYLATSGSYIIADPAADPGGYTTKRTEWLAKNPEISAKVGTAVFSPGEDRELVPADSVDRILTFRNIHNWEGEKTQEKAFKTFFKSLKPGGILGVVEHRAPTKFAKGKKFDPKSGYVQQDKVVAMAKKAGFKLVAASEINANPKDTKDYAKGVWTLPPRLAEGETDKDKYVAIGESDRMTLKFQKPMPKTKK